MSSAATPQFSLRPPGHPAAATDPAGAATVIALSGGLRSAGFWALDRLVIEALEQGHHHLVLDMHQVSKIEPEALGLLWAELRDIRRRGGTLAAAGAPPALRPALAALCSGGLALYGTVGAALSEIHDMEGCS